MNLQQQWNEVICLQCEIDNELHYNPSSVFWQKANAILQLRKFKMLAVEHAEHRRFREERQRRASYYKYYRR